MVHHGHVKDASNGSFTPLSSLGDSLSKNSSLSLESGASNVAFESLSDSIASSGVPPNRNIRNGSRLAAMLRKKSASLNGAWKEYFFVLQGGFIDYYSSGAYVQPKGSYVLLNCTVGEVKEIHTSGKILYTIQIVWNDKQQLQKKHRRVKTSDCDLNQSPSGRSEIQSPVNPSLVHESFKNKEQQQQQHPKNKHFFGVVRSFRPGLRRRRSQPLLSKSGDDAIGRPRSLNIKSGDDTVVDNATLQTLMAQQQQQTMNSTATNQDNSGNIDNGEDSKVGSKSYISVAKAVGLGAAATVGVGIGAVTMGIGWIPLLVVFGVGAGTSGATGGGAHFYNSRAKKKRSVLHIGSESMETISEWKDTILWEIERMETSKCTVHSMSHQQSPNRITIGSPVHSETTDSSGACFDTNKLIVADCIIRQQDWTCDCIENGVRVFIAQRNLDVPVGTVNSFPAKDKPILMCRVKFNCSRLEALFALLSFPDLKMGGFWRSMRVVERLDDNKDIIEVTSEASTLGGVLCASPRIFYLARYWHLNEDGSYFLEMTSCWNNESSYLSTNRELTRGLLRSIYTFTARPDSSMDKPCLVTHYCQCDPMGLVGYSSTYFAHLYARKAVLSFVDIKDNLEYADFQRFEFDTDLLPRTDGLDLIRDSTSTLLGMSSYDTELQMGSSVFKGKFFDVGSFHTFKLRGQTYMVDREKVPGGASVGKLVRCDLFRLSPGERADDISSMGRCSEHINRLISPGSTLFVLNYQLYKPALSFVVVWKVPDEGGPHAFQTLWQKFVDLPEGLNNGELSRDDFRSRRFKLLPTIVDGPWIVRKVVGSTPVLIGQKLTCRYFRRPGIFELDIDLHSCKIASNAVSLVKSHSKSVIVDMAVTIQGENEDELPESLIGTVRLDRLDLSLAESLWHPSREQPGRSNIR